MRGLRVRRARLEDLQTIQRLNHELFKHDNDYHHDLNLEWPYEPDGEAYFRSCIEGDDLFVSIVAEYDGAVVGYLNGGIRKPHSAYLGKRAELENMCVTAEFRGYGIGTKLIDEFKSWAHDQGADRLIVEAFHGNDEALRFYEKNGFRNYALTLSQLARP